MLLLANTLSLRCIDMRKRCQMVQILVLMHSMVMRKDPEIQKRLDGLCFFNIISALCSSLCLLSRTLYGEALYALIDDLCFAFASELIT
jgi:hypothetical protein